MMLNPCSDCCGCAFARCSVPKRDLTLNYNNLIAGVNLNLPLTYTNEGSLLCLWQSSCFFVPGHGWGQLVMVGFGTLSASIGQIITYAWNDPTCSYFLESEEIWNWPGNGPDFTCNPLNIVLRTGVAPYVFWTITVPNQ